MVKSINYFYISARTILLERNRPDSGYVLTSLSFGKSKIDCTAIAQLNCTLYSEWLYLEVSRYSIGKEGKHLCLFNDSY